MLKRENVVLNKGQLQFRVQIKYIGGEFWGHEGGEREDGREALLIDEIIETHPLTLIQLYTNYFL